jgi:hypothetical protein
MHTAASVHDGIRSRDDYCVVMLAGGRLMHRLHDPGALSHFSAASGAQLRLVAEQLAEGGTAHPRELQSASLRVL